MPNYLFCLTYLILSSFPAITAEPGIWVGTELTFSVAKNLLNTKNCYRNALWLNGCLESLQAAFATSSKNLVLTLDNPTSSTKVLRRWGALSLVQLGLRDNQITTMNKPESRRTSLFAKSVKHHFQEQRESQNVFNVLFWIKNTSNRQEKIPFDDINTWLEKNFLNSKNTAEVTAVVINKIMSLSTDRFAHIYPKQEFQTDLTKKDEFVGIGVSLKLIEQMGERRLVVKRVFDNSSAFKKGIQVDDIVTRVDNLEVSSKNINLAMERLKGRPNTKVTVHLKRNQRRLKFSLNRQIVLVPNVTSKFLGPRNMKIGYLQIESFANASTCSEVRAHLKNVLAHRVNGFILDLRDNVGGLVSQGVCISSLFLNEGDIVISTQEDQNLMFFNSARAKFTGITGLPLIILINQNSASASEIVAGSLQDHGRALLFGTPSHGKGSFQKGFPWSKNKSIIYFKTVSRFFLPSGKSTEQNPLQPDVLIQSLRASENSSEKVLHQNLTQGMLRHKFYGRLLNAACSRWNHDVLLDSRSSASNERRPSSVKYLSHDIPLEVAQQEMLCMLSSKTEETVDIHQPSSVSIFSSKQAELN